MRLSLLFIGFLMVFPITIRAQESRKMLIFEIDHNQYRKCNYNEKGKLESFQKLNIGAIDQKSEVYRLPVTIYNFTVNGELKDSTNTIYTCNPDEQKILVNILPYTDYSDNNVVNVDPQGTNAIYPVNPETGWKMNDLKFEMKIDKGVIGFLGGKSRIEMKHRRVVPNDTVQTGQYEIDSIVNIRIYVLGIKMKTLNYTVIEIIDPDDGIIHQMFTSDEGSYFVIDLI